jgi:hypothetical protein
MAVARGPTSASHIEGDDAWTQWQFASWVDETMQARAVSP